jgi:ABC-2 type transport system ATP-binding protein
MQIDLIDAAVGHGPAADLPPITLTVNGAAPTIVATETERRPTVLSLVAGGRMNVDAGSVLVDGRRDDDRLRELTALVDTPLVADPPGDVALSEIIGEELMLAGRKNNARAVRQELDRFHAASYAAEPITKVPSAIRLRLLTELAASRPGVEALIITSPERFGGNPHDWWALANEFCARGYAVLVITNEAALEAVRALGNTAGAPTSNLAPTSSTKEDLR